MPPNPLILSLSKGMSGAAELDWEWKAGSTDAVLGGRINRC